MKSCRGRFQENRWHGSAPEASLSFIATDGNPIETRLELPRTLEAGVTARRHLTEHFAAGLSEKALADAAIVVSELANNAVLHGQGRIMLCLRMEGGRLRIEVVDEGKGAQPAIRDQPHGTTGGWGLRVVDLIALDWGALAGTGHVWADLQTS
jgi:anti-sigma regulatory factor (Ser/Thr protein kinase)